MSILKQRFVITGTQLAAACAKMAADSFAFHDLDGEPEGELKRRLKGAGIFPPPADKPSPAAIGDLCAKAILFYLKEK